jgi:fructokinase
MNPTVFGVGEVLWDLLPSGPQLGGAPTNFAFHAAGLGSPAGVVTRVGRDELGDRVSSTLTSLGLSTALVQTDPDLPTGTVSVTLSDAGIPDYVIHEPAAWDRLAATPAALEAMQGAGAVCFGSLAQRSAEARVAIQALVAATPESAWRILDVNLRQHYFDRSVLEASLQLANVFKLNVHEVPVVADLVGVTGDLRARVERLAERYSLRVVAVTQGEVGSLLLREGRWSHRPARIVDVKDTVGAGDAFTAALCVGLLRGLDLDAVNAVANEVAAFVCAAAGATPTLPDAFRQRLA